MEANLCGQSADKNIPAESLTVHIVDDNDLKRQRNNIQNRMPKAKEQKPYRKMDLRVSGV